MMNNVIYVLASILPLRLGKPMYGDIYSDLAVASEGATDIKKMLEEVYGMQEDFLSRSIVSLLIFRYDKNNDIESALEYVFGDLNKELIHAMRTEDNGLELSDIFDFQSENLSRRELVRGTVRRALVYPFTVLIVSLVVLTILLLAVVPQFADMFSNFGSDLPGLTNLLISFSEIVQTYWWISVVFLIIPIVYRMRRSRIHIDKMILKIPFISSIHKQLALLQCMETLLSLKYRGITPKTKIKYACYSISNIYLRDTTINELSEAHEEDGIIAILCKLSLMPKRLKRRLSVNYDDDMNDEVEDDIQNEMINLAGRVDNISAVLGTVFSIIIAIFIGIIVIGMYLPIFQLGMLIS